KMLVGTNASPEALAAFVAGKVDAAVIWEPDISEALRRRPDSHILWSTEVATNLIADIMVARDAWISPHAQIIEQFIRGWLDGTAEANRIPESASRLLMREEPLFKSLGK